jgi:hypothetical protein
VPTEKPKAAPAVVPTKPQTVHTAPCANSFLNSDFLTFLYLPYLSQVSAKKTKAETVTAFGDIKNLLILMPYH